MFLWQQYWLHVLSNGNLCNSHVFSGDPPLQCSKVCNSIYAWKVDSLGAELCFSAPGSRWSRQILLSMNLQLIVGCRSVKWLHAYDWVSQNEGSFCVISLSFFLFSMYFSFWWNGTLHSFPWRTQKLLRVSIWESWSTGRGLESATFRLNCFGNDHHRSPWCLSQAQFKLHQSDQFLCGNESRIYYEGCPVSSLEYRFH